MNIKRYIVSRTLLIVLLSASTIPVIQTIITNTWTETSFVGIIGLIANSIFAYMMIEHWA